jgi:hypothetical protein
VPYGDARFVAAYGYDILVPDTWVEWNQCRYTYIHGDVVDTLYRAMPSFRKHHPKVGQYRNDLDYYIAKTVCTQKLTRFTRMCIPRRCAESHDGTVYNR